MTDTTKIEEIEVSIKSKSDPEEYAPGCCTGDYIMEIVIDGHTVEANGWALLGWLAPGAHADLDGSGLEVWGDGQSGGWTQCDGDGREQGLPRAKTVQVYEAGRHIAMDSEIVIGDVTVTADDIHAWRTALDAEDADPEAIRDQIIEAINDAIEFCGSPSFGEPDAKTIYDDLRHIDDLRDLPVRIDDWQGAGLVLAWRDGNKYEFAYWPNQDDVRRAVDSATESVDDAEMAEHIIMSEIERAEEMGTSWTPGTGATRNLPQ